MMNIDVIGRVRNISLSKSNALYPLFEAVVNSIHAVSDAEAFNGQIAIEVIRDESQELLPETLNDTRPIIEFVIVDNGVGFDDKNFESFCTSDTRYKLGSKGIGRFAWLKAFDEASIESVYQSEQGFFLRKFNFRLTKSGIENDSNERTVLEKLQTKVSLVGFKPEYADNCPKSLESIAERIVEHCLSYFLSERCPQIAIKDGMGQLNLNELFRKQIQADSHIEKFSLKSEEFEVINLRLHLGKKKEHTLNFCANDRVVKHIDASKVIPDLSSRVADESGTPFRYIACIKGAFLDNNLNPERTAFTFPEDTEDSLLADEITFAELQNSTLDCVKGYLKPYLEPVARDKLEDIKKHIQNEAPQYRPILKYNLEALDKIPPNLPKNKLDAELHKLYSEMTLALRKRISEVTKGKTLKNWNDYREGYEKLVEETTEFSMAQLSQYVIHRKLMLDLLESSLQSDADGKYQLEETVHRIIFPMRVTSDDISEDMQNLWLLDERLIYHRYLASDKPLHSFPLAQVDSAKEPDLLVVPPSEETTAPFNKSIAFVEDSESPFDSVVLVEFKRPMREQYNADKDSILKQIYAYIRDIRDGKATTKNGRPFRIKDGTRFYVYLICDLVPRLERELEDATFKKMPENDGYFFYHEIFQAWIEVIPYDKLLKDAKRRNRILFEKLNLPSS